MSTTNKKSVVVTIDLTELHFFKDRSSEEVTLIIKAIADIIDYHGIEESLEVLLDCLTWMPYTDWYEGKQGLERINSLLTINTQIRFFGLMIKMLKKDPYNA